MINNFVKSPTAWEGIRDNFLLDSYQNNKSVFKKEFKFLCELDKLVAYLTENFPDCLVLQTGDNTVFKVGDTFVRIFSNETITITLIFGEREKIQELYDLLSKKFPEVTSTIKWVYNQHGQRITLSLNNENHCLKEFFPMIATNSLEEYYDAYVNSKSSILILIGPPGTGKTSFVRGLLHHSSLNAILSYNMEVLAQDSFFASFISDGDTQVLVLEDADSLLVPRKDGNNMMMKFLNIAEGLVSSSGKKIIFTTNLPNVKHIDQALVRPGRCFDILHFDKLTPEQANVVATKMNLADTVFTESVTLAEVFNPREFSSSLKPKTIGF
jgi:hypothetical protein